MKNIFTALALIFTISITAPELIASTSVSPKDFISPETIALARRLGVLEANMETLPSNNEGSPNLLTEIKHQIIKYKKTSIATAILITIMCGYAIYRTKYIQRKIAKHKTRKPL